MLKGPVALCLGLLPCHFEFNPIELVWTKVKNSVSGDNRNFKLSMVEDILREKIKHIMAED